jgi:hypothetical protein
VRTIFENSDFDKDEVINEEEWNQTVTPIQKEYRILLNCRAEKGVEPDASISDVRHQPFPYVNFLDFPKRSH